MAAPMVVLGAALVVLVIGILSCADYVRETGNPDPSECVIDELAGQWLASAFVAFAPLSLPAFFFSFVLFPHFRHLEALADLSGGNQTAWRPGGNDGRYRGRTDGGCAGLYRALL